jgi:proteasome assembly chaperone (PAC2) family protein|tara:strand:+ start:196 stop:360 length:165 start_codon:yes stop_codon:yes gene_type:complete
MGWKIDLENDFEKLKNRVTKLEKILESLNEAVKAPKKKPVKKRRPKDLKVIAEA